MRCPGQDMRFWKPGDIFETECPKCGAKVEFFKDEVKRRCRCGHEMVNLRIDLGCAQWCPYAEQCVGNVPEEVRVRQKAEQKNLMKERIALEMKKYFGTHFRWMNHALKVARQAEQILKSEGGNPLVVLGAAYLLDVGFREEEKANGSSSEHFRQRGVRVAEEILAKLSIEEDISREICEIIAHHHSTGSEETLNFQIVHESDWLVRFEEVPMDLATLEKIVSTEFKTVTGKQMAAKLYLR